MDLLILFVVVLYLSLIYWTYNDARRRIEDPMLVGCATAASLFPFVGTIIYMILRPPEYLEDVRERELETHATEVRLHELEGSLCPHCDYRIEPDFVRCPSCLRKLKERCLNCSKPLDRTWTICPYCEADVPGLDAPRPRRRRILRTRGGERRSRGGRARAQVRGGPQTRRRRAVVAGGAGDQHRDGDRARRRVAGEELDPDAAAPVAAAEPATRRRSTGRSPRPGGRPRPTS